MEIELPDGTVLDAPDGSDPRAVVKGYKRARLVASNPGEYDPKSKPYAEKYGPVSEGLQGFKEGVGSGSVRMSRGLSNMANKFVNALPAARMIGGVTLPHSDPQEIKDQDILDKPLADTTRGALGQVLGQTATGYVATAPIGVLGSVGRGGNMLTRTLAAPGTQTALEGAITGAAAADPDEQAGGALKGAAAAYATQKLLQLGGRGVRGLVRKNEATRDLEALAGNTLDIPLSQAATDDDIISRSVRGFYQEGLPNVIGVRGRLARQSRVAQQAAHQVPGGLADALTEEIFSEPVSRGTRTGRLLTTIGLGTGAYASPVSAGSALIGAHTLASQTAQRALMGDTAAQKALVKIIQSNPNGARIVRKALEQAAAAEAGD